MAEYVAPVYYPYQDQPSTDTPATADDFANPLVEAMLDVAGSGGRLPAVEATIITHEARLDTLEAGTGGSTGGGISVMTPADTGLKAWTIDPALANAGQILPSAGVVYLFKVRLDDADTITGITFNITTAGATIANGYVALFDATGARVAVSAAITTAWQATGYVSNAFTSPYAAAAGIYYAAVLVGSAGTLPTLSRQAQNVAAINGLTTAATGFRFGASGSGQTAMPSSVTLGSTTAALISYHVGLY